MTNKLHTLHTTQAQTLGDMAVDGLLNGVAAGIAMAVTLAIMALIVGETLTAMFSRFNTGNADMPLLAGLLGHLALSAIYGTAFGLVWHRLATRVRGIGTVLIGVIYGLLLFAVAILVVLPAVQSPMQDIPMQFGLAHLVYGLTLGALFARSQR